MAMVGGSASATCSANGSASVTGTGLALALANGRMAARITQFTNMAAASPGGVLPATVLATYQALANQVCSDATADGDAIVTYVAANAVVATPVSGLTGVASGVTAGAAVSGPLVCTGSLAGTVS